MSVWIEIRNAVFKTVAVVIAVIAGLAVFTWVADNISTLMSVWVDNNISTPVKKAVAPVWMPIVQCMDQFGVSPEFHYRNPTRLLCIVVYFAALVAKGFYKRYKMEPDIKEWKLVRLFKSFLLTVATIIVFGAAAFTFYIAVPCLVAIIDGHPSKTKNLKVSNLGAQHLATGEISSAASPWVGKIITDIPEPTTTTIFTEKKINKQPTPIPNPSQP